MSMRSVEVGLIVPNMHCYSNCYCYCQIFKDFVFRFSGLRVMRCVLGIQISRMLSIPKALRPGASYKPYKGLGFGVVIEGHVGFYRGNGQEAGSYYLR